MNGKILMSCGVLAMALAACSSPQQRAQNRAISQAQRTLERIPSIGDPGRVAAADIAFARQARDEGQWTAFRATHAPGAQIHGQNGLVPAAEWLTGREDPEQSVAWTPNTVWSSCDGTLAVSFGRFQQPDGDVGSYVTVWELTAPREYAWTYDMGGLDNPQPQPERGPDIPEGEEVIIVPGMTAINGMVADCNSGPDTLPPPTPAELAQGWQSGGTISRDRTLQWRWFHNDRGQRAVSVDWLRNGEWQTALEFTAPPPLED